MPNKIITVLFVGLFLFPAALLARTKDAIDRKAMEEWKGIHAPAGAWTLAITPPMPEKWPPTKKNVMYLYTYARSTMPADAPKVSAPWGRVTLQNDGTFTLETWTKKITDVENQPVHPLRDPGAISLFKRAEIFEGVLMQVAAGTAVNDRDVSEMKRYYCAWSSTDSVIAGKIRPRHVEFFKWLGCEK
jgi:hypothetical protein